MKYVLSIRQKLVISVAVGAMTALLGWLFLQRAEKRIKNQFAMTTVLQARKYIKDGKRVDASVVEEVPIPTAYLPPMALQSKSDLLNSQGEPIYKTRGGILKGEFLSKSRLMDGAAMRTLEWTLSPGQTAITLKLSPEQCVGAMIRPGDHVNVYGTLDQTQMLFSRVLVLALDERLWDEAEAAATNNTDAGVVRESHLITLALSPDEAGRAVLAADKGRIVLALTSPLDTQIHKMRPLTWADIR